MLPAREIQFQKYDCMNFDQNRTRDQKVGSLADL